VFALAALAPSCPSVPPGAGNEAKKVLKPEAKRAKQVDERELDGIDVDGYLDAPTVRRHDDDDGAAILIAEQTQSVLQIEQTISGGPEMSGKSTRQSDDRATTHTALDRRRRQGPGITDGRLSAAVARRVSGFAARVTVRSSACPRAGRALDPWRRT
jgi:hypothetical protein